MCINLNKTSHTVARAAIVHFPGGKAFFIFYLFPHLKNKNIQCIIRKNVMEDCPEPSRGLKSVILQAVITRNMSSYNNPLNL